MGAGASAVAPTRLPTFPSLAEAVLRAIGWTPSEDGKAWAHRRYGRFDTAGVAAEVLFGTLNRFHVNFAAEVARVLCGGEPNAVHAACARVLAAGGSVWTTNIDRCIEATCETVPHRAGRAAASGLLDPLRSAVPGTLVKFHGTAEAPHTLAFTDRELLAPLPDPDMAHLKNLAAGRDMIVYGYAAADADLFGLLEATFDVAARILWFEPTLSARRSIERTFPDARPRFIPKEPPQGFADAVAATGREFLELTDAAGIDIDPVLAKVLPVAAQPPPSSVEIGRPPGVTHARLVERFGPAGADRRALSAARREDLCSLRVDALPGHLRWAVNRSLYEGGVVAATVDALTERRAVLRRLPPTRLRNWAITRGHALRLQGRDWQKVEEFATWAVEHRPGGPQASDFYYRAQGRRYALLVNDGLADADRAAAGLSVAGDPERHAGAVLEQGCLAIYQGRFEAAMRAAFELRQRTGRYAIPRWQAWGAWLEAIALCHLAQPAEARNAADVADERFEAEARPGPLADIRTARLLAARVELALGAGGAMPVDREGFADAEPLGRRYVDDRCLVLADLAIGHGDVAAAERLLGRIMRNPSCPVAEGWAALGQAEVTRLRNDQGSAGGVFARVARLGAERGAWWLQAQAAIGLELCGGGESAWGGVPDEVREAARARHALGEPRLLWMMIA